MRTVLFLLVVAAVAGMAFVRLAPSDPERWHTDPAEGTSSPNSYQERSAVLAQSPEAALAAFAAAAPPRTRVVAGRPEEGRMTFVTRSLVVGFPDYTTVAAVPVEGGVELVVFGRSRFGYSDLGVNRARVTAWLAALQGQMPPGS